MVAFWVQSETHQLSASVRGAFMILYAFNIFANPIAYFFLNKTARRQLQCRRCKQGTVSNTMDSSQYSQHAAHKNSLHDNKENVVSIHENSATGESHRVIIPMTSCSMAHTGELQNSSIYPDAKQQSPSLPPVTQTLSVEHGTPMLPPVTQTLTVEHGTPILPPVTQTLSVEHENNSTGKKVKKHNRRHSHSFGGTTRVAPHTV